MSGVKWTPRHLVDERCGKCNVKGGVWIEADGYSFCTKCQHKSKPKGRAKPVVVVVRGEQGEQLALV